MKANEILKCFGVPKTKETIKHCTYYANVLTLIKELTCYYCAEIIEENRNVFIGRWSHDNPNYKGYKFDGYEKKANIIQIETETGQYTFSIPVENEYYYKACELLRIKYTVENEQTPVYKNSFVVDAAILKQIKTALKFIGKDKDSFIIRPALKCVCLHVIKNKLRVVATDANTMYLGKWFDIATAYTVYGGEMYLKISREDSETVLTKLKGKTTRISVGITDGNIYFDGIRCSGNTDLNYPDYCAVIPDYTESMKFVTEDFSELINNLLPYANKYTNKLKFHLNGNISAAAENVDYSTKSENSIDYLEKTFPDLDITFNGKFLLKSLSVFDKKETIKMKHNGTPNKPAIFTNGSESVLCMPMYNH